MTIDTEIKSIIENQIELMINQTKAYLPFVRLAFPGVKDLSDAAFSLIVANVLPVFLTQYAMRLKSPSEQDFVEFGILTNKYKEKIKKMF